MARSRSTKPVLTNVQAGSQSATDYSETELAVAGNYPEEHQDSRESWKRAYDHAAGFSNTIKAAVLYADGHMEDFESTEE